MDSAHEKVSFYRNRFNIKMKDFNINNEIGILDRKDISLVEKVEKKLTKKKAQLIAYAINTIKKSGRELTWRDFFSESEYTEWVTAERISGYLRENIDFEKNYEIALKMIRTGCKSTKINMQYELADICFIKQNYKSSLEFYENIYDFYLNNPVTKKLSVVAKRLSYFYQQLNRLDDLEILYLQVKKHIDSLDDSELLKMNLAIGLSKKKKFDEALELLEDIEYHSEFTKQFRPDINSTVFYCYAHKGEFKQAIDKILLQLRVNRTDIEYRETLYFNLAGVYVIEKNQKQIRLIYEKIKRICFSDIILKENSLRFREAVIRLAILSDCAIFMDDYDAIAKSYIKMTRISYERNISLEHRKKILVNFFKVAVREDLTLVEDAITYSYCEGKVFSDENILLYINDYFIRNSLLEEYRDIFRRIIKKS